MLGWRNMLPGGRGIANSTEWSAVVAVDSTLLLPACACFQAGFSGSMMMDWARRPSLQASSESWFPRTTLNQHNHETSSAMSVLLLAVRIWFWACHTPQGDSIGWLVTRLCLEDSRGSQALRSSAARNMRFWPWSACSSMSYAIFAGPPVPKVKKTTAAPPFSAASLAVLLAFLQRGER